VAVICGTAGVGKTSVAVELSLLLATADVAHALIGTDELDRVHPWPPPGWASSDLSERNLAALWSTYAGLGQTRLVLCAVMVDVPRELTWIARAVPGAAFTVFRLAADGATLEERVHRRELGSGAAAQLERTLRYAAAIDDPDDVIRIDTTELDVTTVARRILERLAW
jgi:broad-specificity NMP kinase